MRKIKKQPKASLKDRLLAAGANPKQVLLMLAGLDLAMIVLGVYFYFQGANMIICLSFLFIAPIADYWLIHRLLKGKSKSDYRLETEFVRIFGYLSVYLQDGIPVYSSLERIRQYASAEMDERLKALLQQIDEDKSVAPYVKFASGFPSLMIKEVMISLYLISEQGGIEVYLPQFQKSFDLLAEEKRRFDRERRVSSLNTMCFLPLVGSGMSLLMIVSGMVVLMRELSSGI